MPSFRAVVLNDAHRLRQSQCWRWMPLKEAVAHRQSVLKRAMTDNRGTVSNRFGGHAVTGFRDGRIRPEDAGVALALHDMNVAIAVEFALHSDT